MRQPIVALVALVVAAAAPQAVAGCLRYDGRVTVGGKLVRQTFPGAPSFESIKDGDESETGWYVILDRPICMAQGISDITETEQKAVRRVHLILTPEQYRSERYRLNRRVAVSGEPWSRHTGHHHAPILLTGVEFR